MRTIVTTVVMLFLGLANPAMADEAYPSVSLLSTGTTVIGETIRYPDSGPAKVVST
ncbi:MAG: cupin domain-containing protein, partial [Magnetospirillum sp.]|nr:cupin domain-containing protein [Magnetospirillum sp.]